MPNIDNEKNEKYYNEILEYIHKGDESFEMWQDMLKKLLSIQV